MDSTTVNPLREHIEPMAALSTSHLSVETRQKLINDDLSVNAYPNEYGGWVYVGAPAYSAPTEPDLAEIFKVASEAGVVWLRFDHDGAVIDGLPIFENPEELDPAG